MAIFFVALFDDITAWTNSIGNEQKSGSYLKDVVLLVSRFFYNSIQY